MLVVARGYIVGIVTLGACAKTCACRSAQFPPEGTCIQIDVGPLYLRAAQVTTSISIIITFNNIMMMLK